ncbi:hypothetical protein BKK54_03785 [Rodentibacter genomosp. 1]|uniref:histidine kinase n=1 Tax=Rodentibacter genomosp. 1 TaxID=1908264 RepID=A0A1V3J7M4_9PAST|nr:ATP-binding protein [Rodentibacter genomosp. 1]OOF51220.1 hypothetical protein BKK54_03785 [Rodentibacter genomosp. 1]
MENLKYIIEDSTIAELLGVQNFSTDEAAILELVKNAYDANALNLTMEFMGTMLKITDDGDGMDSEDIKKHWMHIGKSSKGYSFVDINKNVRVQAGSKGVGRFALSRLGKNVRLHSKKIEKDGVIWETDWNKSTLYLDHNIKNKGTCILINNLREKWSTNRIKKLNKYLERTYHDTAMKIRIKSNEYDEFIGLHFPEPEPGKNCRSNIKLEYDKGILSILVFSDEFTNEAEKYCPKIDLNKHISKVNIIDELEGNDIIDLSGYDLINKLNELGRFSANLFFNLNATNYDKEKFLYKYLNTIENIESGVILYRNAFSISSFEGEKDWLGLGKRSRKSPAAASHPTGSWRVRENQISGYVLIDKKINYMLQDLMNRQGLDENIYYKLFVQIILIGLKEFERYRQDIVRAINIKNKKEEEISTNKISDKIVNNPKKLDKLDDRDKKQLIDELKSFRQDSKKFEREKSDVEARYKYDVRILNVLATIGLKASSIAHEMKTDRNVMYSNCSYIIDALKEYGLWEKLNHPENTNKHHKNIPSLLKRMDDVGKKIISFMDTMLIEIEKKQFKTTLLNIKEVVTNIKNVWEKDYGTIKINIDSEENTIYNISEDLVRVILDNLILNSIQQNETNFELKLSIKIIKHNEFILIIYSDNGIGLDHKYVVNPFKILEVHETTRNNGHGLGMWIVNNTITMTGGEIKKIEGSNGFKIEFTLGDKS